MEPLLVTYFVQQSDTGDEITIFAEECELEDLSWLEISVDISLHRPLLKAYHISLPSA